MSSRKVILALIVLSVIYAQLRDRHSPSDTDAPADSAASFTDAPADSAASLTDDVTKSAPGFMDTLAVLDTFGAYSLVTEADLPGHSFAIVESSSGRIINALPVTSDWPGGRASFVEIAPLPGPEVSVSSSHGGSGGVWETFEIYGRVLEEGQAVRLLSTTGEMMEPAVATFDSEAHTVSVFGRDFVWAGDVFEPQYRFHLVDAVPGVAELYADWGWDTIQVALPNGLTAGMRVEVGADVELWHLGDHILVTEFFDPMAGCCLHGVERWWELKVFEFTGGALREVFHQEVGAVAGDLADGYELVLSESGNEAVLYAARTTEPDSITRGPRWVSSDDLAGRTFDFEYRLGPGGFTLSREVRWFAQYRVGVSYGLPGDSVLIHGSPDPRDVLLRLPPAHRVWVDALPSSRFGELVLVQYPQDPLGSLEWSFSVYRLRAGGVEGPAAEVTEEGRDPYR